MNFPFLLAIEIDPEHIRHHSGGGRTALLDQGDAGQMLAHLGADLTKLLGAFRKCRLTAAGALFDQCQILRPDTPVLDALAGIAETSGKAMSPGLTAVGAQGETMADPALQPDPILPPGLLSLLPIIASGPDDLIAELSSEMEHRFLAEGQVSAHTASWLESAFGIGIGHARFMTLIDLNAMFRMQLENFGYLPLWTLIDAAVHAAPDALVETTDNGTRLEWRDGRVHIAFQTFNHWAQQVADSGGNEGQIEGDGLARAYAEWTRELRRYTSTLAAHHVPLAFELPEGCTGAVAGDFLYEDVDAPDVTPDVLKTLASITEHGWPDLGTVAITALMPHAMRHYYPLTAQGLNRIHEALATLELAGEGMAFPGTIKFNPDKRALRPVVIDPT